MRKLLPYSDYIMPSAKQRSYDDYEKLKKKACSSINRSNALSVLQSNKKKLLAKFETLAVNNLIDVEDFYLIMLKITQSAGLIWAQKKAEKKGISFEEAHNSFGTEDLQYFLLKNFKFTISPCNINKIQQIDNLYKPCKQGWAGLHLRSLVLRESLVIHQFEFDLKIEITKQIKLITQKSQKLGTISSTKIEQICADIKQYTDQYLGDHNKTAFIENVKKPLSETSIFLENKDWQKKIDGFVESIINFINKMINKPQSPNAFSFFNTSLKEQITDHVDQLDNMIDSTSPQAV